MLLSGSWNVGRGREVVVTGASGFIGRRLLEAFAMHGVQTRALVRAPSSVVEGPGRSVFVTGLDDRVALRSALRGAEVLVHLAGRAHVVREGKEDPAIEFRRVNVDGTRTLLDTALDAGVSRIVHMSSIGAVATSSEDSIDDGTRSAPDSIYGRSKLESETVVREMCEKSGAEYVILRPPMVFGPGMKGNPLRLFHLVASGVPLPLGLVRNRRSLIYVDNLVCAIEDALALRAGVRETYVLGDGPPMSSAALVREVAHALHVPARLLPVPPSLMRIAGAAGDLFARVVPFPLTSDAVERLFGSLPVDYSRFAIDAHYSPPIPRAEAMRRTAHWFLKEAR